MAVGLVAGSDHFNQRLTIFTLIEQLNHLCRDVQRHRGRSMGFLAGNKNFYHFLCKLQCQIDRRVQWITAFANRAPELLSHSDMERLHYAWNTIRDNWQDDSVHENFEYHSHFIDQLFLIMNRLLETVSQPFGDVFHTLLGSKAANDASQHSEIYFALLKFAHRRLPRFVEILGKLRALSVHAAATGHCDVDSQKKLHYLLQCIARERESLFEVASNLQIMLINDLPALLTIKTYEYKLDFLLEKIDKEIIQASIINVGADDVFNLVTDIIDVYWRVIDDSLSLLQYWQKRELEQWLIEG